jgi:hypothetical protein
MSVTIYEDAFFYCNQGYFPIGYTPDLSNYEMDADTTWNDQVSSLYTSDYLAVFEDAGYAGDSAILAPGYHSLASLLFYGIDDDSISSFYTLTAYTLPA